MKTIRNKWNHLMETRVSTAWLIPAQIIGFLIGFIGMYTALYAMQGGFN